jgi:hypothetical protein
MANEITVEGACCELFRRNVIARWGSFEGMQTAAREGDELARMIDDFLGLRGAYANTTIKGTGKGNSTSAAHA